MLEQNMKNSISNTYKALLKNGRRSRWSQRIMIAEVAKTIVSDENKILVAEAPTGTGKSLAYLTGALPLALKMNKKLIISTSTVALQEQIASKDLPDFLRETGLSAKAVIAKGRGRYVCTARLSKKTGYSGVQPDLFADVMDELETVNTKSSGGLYALAKQLEGGAWNGERDTLREEMPDELWREINVSEGGCIGSSCRFRDRCPQVLARAEIQHANIVIANHDLLLSGLKAGDGVILPKLEDSILVLDESHSFPAIATRQFGEKLSVKKMRSYLPELATLIDRTNSATNSLSKTQVKLAMNAVIYLKDALVDFTNLVGSDWPAEQVDTSKQEGNRILRFRNAVTPEALVDSAKNLSLLSKGIADVFGKLLKDVKDAIQSGKTSRAITDDQMIRLSEIAAYFENSTKFFCSFSENCKDNSAKWVEQSADDIMLEYRPMGVAGKLKEIVWNNAFAAIITSATLTSLGRFEHFRRNAGLPYEPGAVYLKLASPFDYSRASLSISDPESADPSNAKEHTEYVSHRLPGLINQDGGTLVLFASRKQLEDVRDAMSEEIRQLILSQTDMPKHVILSEHKTRIETGLPSVIFGLASFSEGVDLPGDLCKHVVISKLPFESPGGPYEASLAESIEARGGNVFREVMLPNVCIRLIQAVGRLIRTEVDEGRITILDNRLKTKRYGRELLSALPEKLSIVT